MTVKNYGGSESSCAVITPPPSLVRCWLVSFGRPDIFNTDQESHFTSAAFTGALIAPASRISMDGRRLFVDNVLIERLWCLSQ